MKAAKFDYVVARTVADAAASLSADGASAAIIAGGQSLVPMLNLRVAVPDLLVDISTIDELRETAETTSAIRIGALTTHAEIEDGKIPDPCGGLLRKVASGISYRAIRNYGTIGGSLALADPAADWPVCLMALDARARIDGGIAPRTQNVADLIEGQYTTSLGRSEIIVAVEIARSDKPLRWGFHKVARKSGAFAESIAVAVDRGGSDGVSVALGGAVMRPFLLKTVAGRVAADDSDEAKLRAAIAEDLTGRLPQADAYLRRLHISTVLRALRKLQCR